MPGHRKSSAIALAAALAAIGLTGGRSTPAVGSEAAETPTPTSFGLEASGYASRVDGGQLSTGSDKLAYSVVACTNDAGVSNTNALADGNTGNGFLVQGASTHAWTAKSADTVSAWSTNHIDQITLSNTPTGDLTLTNLRSTSHAWHSATGYHSTSAASLGSIVFSPTIGEDQTFPVPSPGESVIVPGVAEIGLGAGTSTADDTAATTGIDGLSVHTLFSDSITRFAHSRASITGGVKDPLYGGFAYATKSTELGLVTSGRTVPTAVPCVGTDGDWTSNEADETSLADHGSGSALMSKQRSGRTAPGRRPEVTTVSRVSLVHLSGGLQIDSIRARSHVMRTTDGYERDIAGTSVGAITVNGTDQSFPHDTKVMEIPGVAKFERAIVTRTPNSISVVGLRVTMLDGSGAVFDFAFAKALLHPSGM